MTGEDIRLVGNWEPLPGLLDHGAVLADRLDVFPTQLLRCRDIADVVDLMEREGRLKADRSEGPTWF